MKICSNCNEEKLLADFHSNPLGRDGRHSTCASCVNEKAKVYYQNNREKIKARARAYKDKRYEWYIKLKESTPCKDCGKYFPYYVTDWDHIDGTTKVDKVSRLMQTNDDIKVMEEIAKCELVCANCHRIRTHLRNDYFNRR